MMTVIYILISNVSAYRFLIIDVYNRLLLFECFFWRYNFYFYFFFKSINILKIYISWRKFFFGFFLCWKTLTTWLSVNYGHHHHHNEVSIVYMCFVLMVLTESSSKKTLKNIPWKKITNNENDIWLLLKIYRIFDNIIFVCVCVFNVVMV